jgi:hypothetical protein
MAVPCDATAVWRGTRRGPRRTTDVWRRTTLKLPVA